MTFFYCPECFIKLGYYKLLHMPTIKRSLFLVLLVFSFIFINAQTEFPAIGKFSADEINLKECSFDPEAEAIILLDKAVVTQDDQYRLITERRIRIKILNDRGIDRGNIIIPFYSKDDFEFIDKVQAYTFNYNDLGMQSQLVVDKKSIYTEKRNNYYSLIKFAMPAVKKGSIIEYHYISTMKHYGGLEEWEFQSDLPTVQSSYFLEIVSRTEFAYTIQKKNTMPINVKPMPTEGKIYFEMNNIPALRLEPYMDAPRDYIQKVMFQLSGIVSTFGSKLNINTTWGSVAKDLMSGKDFGSQLDKDLKIEEVKRLALTASTQQEKLKAIYNYVKTNIAWTGYDSKYAPDGLKAVWDRKKGTAGEINLLLVNLLSNAGIETYPVLAAERDFGKIDTTYPFLDRFNKTIAFAVADGKQYLLDATQDNCPAGLTPYPILGTSGFLVDKKKFNLIKIAPGNKSYRNMITINGVMDSKGVVTAEAAVKSYDYARQLRLDAVKRDRKKFVNENFEKSYEGLAIDSFSVTPPEQDSLPFEQIVRYKQQLNESGGYIFLNCNLFTGLEKNPFTSSVRFTNVNFGFPYNTIVEETFKLPPGTKVDLPQDQIVRSEDNLIEATRIVKFENNQLKVFIHFTQNVTLIKADKYSAIKEFYKKMVDVLNEPIVLKLSN